MAGHSHSANIKRRKDAVDKKRAKVFSKLARALMSAARQGGGDPDQNLKLKLAIEKAKAGNMPKDNIERAIKAGSGTKEGDDFEELQYEGYAPGGVALMVVALTDNRNRTAADIKHLFERGGGNLGSSGSVSFLFDFRSIFVLRTAGRAEEQLLELALEAGADDLEYEAEFSTILASATSFAQVRTALEAAGLELESSETGYIPQNYVRIESREDAAKVLRLVDLLEENEDVQDVYANYEIADEWMAQLRP